jgi:predicted secreted protein
LKSIKITVAWIVCSLLLLSFIVNVSAHGRIYTILDDNNHISLNSSERFNISLEQSGSTGYLWKLNSYDPSILKLAQDKIWSPGGPTGHPEIHNWTFEGFHGGNTTLKLVKYRPYDANDPNSSIIDTFTMNVTVSGEPQMDKSTNVPWQLIIIVIAVIVIVVALLIIRKLKTPRKPADRNEVPPAV